MMYNMGEHFWSGGKGIPSSWQLYADGRFFFGQIENNVNL